MLKFLTKTDALKLKKIAFPKKINYVGEFYPEIFDDDEGIEFSEDITEDIDIMRSSRLW